MTLTASRSGMTRRQLLQQATAAGAGFMIGAGFVSGQDAAWAAEVQTLKPETMATLIQMARDIYPHDKLGDEFYARAVKSYDTKEKAEATEAGIALLNQKAAAAGHAGYLDVAWEIDRVSILRGIQDDTFFQQMRAGLVTGLYNQKEVWPVFGYEGEAYSQGGYLYRGFDDINWI